MLLSTIVFAQEGKQLPVIEDSSKISIIPIYDLGPVECETCDCQLKNLLRNWTSDNFANSQEAVPVSYTLTDTLLDSLKIEHYRTILLNDSVYFLGYDGNSKILTRLQNKDVMVEEDYVTAFNHYRGLLSDNLHINNIIYTIDVKLSDGKVIKNFAVCNPSSGKIVYDTMFLYIWIFFGLY